MQDDRNDVVNGRLGGSDNRIRLGGRVLFVWRGVREKGQTI